MPDDLMEAVHKAVIEHGYKDLSIAKIADKYSKGKSNIYHHYEGKEDLMLAFLDHLNDCMEQQLCLKDDSPREELDEIVDKMLGLENREALEFRKAMLEMKSEAPYNEKFAEKIEKIDNKTKDIIKQKIDDMNVEASSEKAELILSAIEGTVDRKLTIQNKKELQNDKELIKKIIDLEI